MKNGLGFVESELRALYKRLDSIAPNARREAKAAFRPAGHFLAAAIAGRAPISDNTHYAYDGGKRVAAYHPGNLRRSIRLLNLKTQVAIIVGPKVEKGAASGVYRGNRVDAYYAHWVEFGAPAIGLPPRPFVKPAITAAGGTALRLAVEMMKRKIEQAL